MTVDDCGVCRSLLETKPVWEDASWHVRHLDAPYGVPGWMMLIAKRHVAGPAHFDAGEARSLGPVLCHLERTLEQVTGALRIYTAALGESWPHFHCHMVPRYASMPKDAKGWAVFDLQRAAQAGEIAVDPREVERVSAAYAEALGRHPPEGALRA